MNDTNVVPRRDDTPAASTSSTSNTNAATNDRDEATLLPPVDVLEDANGITLLADLPGVRREALHLHVEGDSLSIEGQLSLDAPADLKAGHAEVQLSRYRRTFTLSKELDPEGIEAELKHGVLTVRIPKAAHLQPRRVEVSVS